jgi:hypothetical protein
MSAAKKHVDWTAWRADDHEVRVQINNPALAKAFSRVESARLSAYSVGGKYLKIFHVEHTIEWVEAWMKEFVHDAAVAKNKGP